MVEREAGARGFTLPAPSHTHTHTHTHTTQDNSGFKRGGNEGRTPACDLKGAGNNLAEKEEEGRDLQVGE